MFSGIVSAMGTVVSVEELPGKWVLGVRSDSFSASDELTGGKGESICVSGVCLTVVEASGDSAFFDIASETRRCTTLGTLGKGDLVNLERSLKFGGSIDGHFVQGHVDAVTEVVSRVDEGNTVKFEFRIPEKIRALIAPKGSVAIDGVSLTVGEVTEETFSVYIIPHTLAVTVFQVYAPGRRVNIEADCIARYVERVARCYLNGSLLG